MQELIAASLSSRQLRFAQVSSWTILTLTSTLASKTKTIRRASRTQTTSTCSLARIVVKSRLTVYKSSRRRIPAIQLHSLRSSPQLVKLALLREQRELRLQGYLRLRVIQPLENQSQPQSPREVCGHQHAAQKKIAKDQKMQVVLPSRSLILLES